MTPSLPSIDPLGRLGWIFRWQNDQDGASPWWVSFRHSKEKCASLVCPANKEVQVSANSFCMLKESCHPLRRVHVVFGVVISGFEVIKKIEGLKTDSASRPYADARVMDCGQLITKSANDGKLGGGSADVDLISSTEGGLSPTHSRFLRQYLKARGSAPPTLRTPPSAPASPPLSPPLRPNCKAKRTKSKGVANARGKEANGQKRSEGNRRRRMRRPPN